MAARANPTQRALYIAYRLPKLPPIRELSMLLHHQPDLSLLVDLHHLKIILGLMMLRRSLETATYSVYGPFWQPTTSARHLCHGPWESRAWRSKHLVPRSWTAFVRAALNEDDELPTFFLTLTLTGARIPEVLALTAESIDGADEGLEFQAPKQRNRKTF